MFTGSEDLTLTRKKNLEAILKVSRDNREVTRNVLKSKLSLSSSSVTKYTQDLIKMGFLREVGHHQSTGGRKSVLLELNPDAGTTLVLIITREGIKSSIIDFTGIIQHQSFTPIEKDIHRDQLLSLIFICIDALIRENNDSRRILGIGIGLGGFLDPIQGISHELLFVRDWDDVPLKKLLEEKYGITSFLVNNAHATALGEKHYGMGIGADQLIVLILGEGVGMGIIIDGELYSGKNFYAGEFGHTRVPNNNTLCYCGHTGCLETITSNSYIVSKCRDALKQHVRSRILRYCDNDPDQLKIDHVIRAANEGDPLARNVFNEVGTSIGIKLSDAINLIDPELVIMRGSAIDGNKTLFDAIERTVMHLTLRPIGKTLRIAYSDKRNESRFLGVHSYILNTYLG